MPKRRWDTPTDPFTAMTAHRPLSSAMHSNYDIDWPVHSLMLSFHDMRGLPLQRLLSTVPCGMIFGSVSWRQTWSNHDSLRRLTVKAPDVRQGYRPVATHIFVCFILSVWQAKHSTVAFVFKRLNSHLQICRQRPLVIISIIRYSNWYTHNVLVVKNIWECVKILCQFAFKDKLYQNISPISQRNKKRRGRAILKQ